MIAKPVNKYNSLTDPDSHDLQLIRKYVGLKILLNENWSRFRMKMKILFFKYLMLSF